ncbi:MAG: hypothetical protein WCF33_22270 [Pseudonocardiaceae bacterium]
MAVFMLSRLSIHLSRRSATGAGTGDGGSPRRNKDLVLLADDVIDGEPDDPAERLRVEEHDHAGNPRSQRRRGVGQEPAEQLQALVLRQRRAPTGRRGGRQP